MEKVKEIKVFVDDILAPVLLGNYLKPFFYSNNMPNDIVIVCVGTDKCIGDSLGPLVGTLLGKRKFPFSVYGTLKHPIHALNLRKKLINIKKDHPLSFIIAIDACLGEVENIGTIQTRASPIFPGKGVGKSLPAIGDLSIIGIVDNIKDDVSVSLNSIRLSFIMDMAEVITESFFHAVHI